MATAIALRSFTVLGTAAWRGALGAAAVAVLLALPAAASLRPRSLAWPATWRLLVLGSLGGPIFIVGMNVAVLLAGATVSAFVAGLYAVVAAALAIPLLDERPEPPTLLALLLALVGTALLAELRLSGEQAGGIAAAGMAAVAFALFLVLSRRWSAPQGLSGLSVAVVNLGLTAVVTGGALLLLGEPALSHALRDDAKVAIVWLGVAVGALSTVLAVSGMRRLPARRASAFLLLNPPTATLAAWVLLGERLSPLQMLGGALVLVAIAGASGLLPGTRRIA